VHVVGLTGGIGSGKSSLARELSGLGVAVFDVDVLARRCVEPGTPGLAAIEERFGASVIGPDGTLDRASLAAIVFVDDAARRDLEAITHPCIRAEIDAEVALLREAPVPPELVVLEHPLLVESGADAWLDAVIAVEAPLASRVDRLVRQRGMTERDALARIAAQVDDEARRAVADRVVVNDGDPDDLRRAAASLLDWLLAGRGGAS